MVETGEKGKSGRDKDTLTFKDGIFHSAGCDQYGFGDGAYTSTVNGDSIQFEAVTTSHWYKPNPKPLEKWAKGELKR